MKSLQALALNYMRYNLGNLVYLSDYVNLSFNLTCTNLYSYPSLYPKLPQSSG